MYVDITTDERQEARVGLRDLDDLTRFSVRLPPECSLDVAANALAQADAGRREGAEFAIKVDWLRHSTAERDEQWQLDFQKMLDYASKKGWMDAERTVVMAHADRG